MYKLCKTEQSAARQRELEQGLLHAMLLRHFEQISVSDLCDQMGVPRKSFYRYFSSKEGALQALIDHTLLEAEGFLDPLSISRSGALRKKLEQFFAYWLKNKPLLDALSRSNMSTVLIERAISLVFTEIGSFQNHQWSDTAETQKFITTFGVCGLMSLVMAWHHEGYVQSVAEIAAVAERVMSQPLITERNG